MGGIKISRFSTNKSLYLANDARYRYSYYGRRMPSYAIYQMVNEINDDDDLEQTLTLLSRSRQSLTLNISQTATDTAIVTIEGE